MAKSKVDITKSYTEFSKEIRGYLEKQGAIEYSEERFRWFRPKDFEDLSDPEKVCEAFSLEELDERTEEFIEAAGMDDGNIGDYAVLALQTDAIIAANKSFASRHRTKLQHIATASGISKRAGEEYGTFFYIYDQVLANLRRQASQSSK